jgi:hypothetical protein
MHPASGSCWRMSVGERRVKRGTGMSQRYMKWATITIDWWRRGLLLVHGFELSDTQHLKIQGEYWASDVLEPETG